MLEEDRRETHKMMAELGKLQHERKLDREQAAARDESLRASIEEIKKALEDMRKVSQRQQGSEGEDAVDS